MAWINIVWVKLHGSPLSAQTAFKIRRQSLKINVIQRTCNFLSKLMEAFRLFEKRQLLPCIFLLVVYLRLTTNAFIKTQKNLTMVSFSLS